MTEAATRPAFTPGPWRAETRKDEVTIIGDEGTMRGVDYAEVIAHAYHEDNARLIAATPDLYEALRDLLADQANCSDHDSHDPDNSIIKRARAALAKADGR